MRDFELIDDLDKRLDDLPIGDVGKLNLWRRRAYMVIEKVFGNTSEYFGEVQQIVFEVEDAAPTLLKSLKEKPESEIAEAIWMSGWRAMKDVITTMRDQLDVFSNETIVNTALAAPVQNSNRIFVVHGHDEAMKQAVARVIERLSFEPIILHEQPNRGRTIIEKFDGNTNVGFAVILLSPDDIGYDAKKQPVIAQARARQNVILEMGFFLANWDENAFLFCILRMPTWNYLLTIQEFCTQSLMTRVIGSLS